MLAMANAMADAFNMSMNEEIWKMAPKEWVLQNRRKG